MSTLTTLTAVIGLGAAATSLAPTARANDWSIGVGIGLPGAVVISPAPVYIRPPPRYYVPPAYSPGYYSPPGYYPPGYYRPPVVGSDEYVDGYGRHRHGHNRHEDDDHE
jgi:hypothetical protein